MNRPLILLTNDDGVDSPGLAAAASVLDPLGDLLIVAPSSQQSGMGRSMPNSFDGRIFESKVRANGKIWPAYSVNASPAQAVDHALYELEVERRPALAVSGINYGENLGTGITISGTVGAAMEAASFGIPSLAVSLQVDPAYHLSNDESVDFSAAAHFARMFAEQWLSVDRPDDVDLIKVDVPAGATPQTEWRLTYLEKRLYYYPVPAPRERLSDKGTMGFRAETTGEIDENSDVGALHSGYVAVVPISLDMTSRIKFDSFQTLFNSNHR